MWNQFLVWLQDIFDMGLLPADTDFRMFSYAHEGRWPGVDVAFLLDAAAYHTDRDTTDRIRQSTLQVATADSCPATFRSHVGHVQAQGRPPLMELVTA